MKRLGIWILDGLAYVVIAVVVLVAGGAMAYGLWLVCRSFVLYLVSWEGRGLGFGLILAAALGLSIKWLQLRARWPEDGAPKCGVCGKAAPVMGPAGPLCEYHGRPFK